MAISGSIRLNPVQQSAASQIYSGFFNYAKGQGADNSTATQFANIGLGTSSGEGLGKSNPFSSNPDNGVTALGPFQLNLNGGVGSDFGLSTNSPASDQIHAAAATMWNGSSDTYNTQPWNALGDTPGTGGNDTFAAQSAAENAGSQIAQRYGLSPDGSGQFATDTSSLTHQDALQDYAQDFNEGQSDGNNPGDYGLTGSSGNTATTGPDGSLNFTIGNSQADQLSQFNAATNNQSAANTAASSAKGGNAGTAGSIPQAIVSAGNQQSQAIASAAQAAAKTAASTTAATNATNTANQTQAENYLSSWIGRIFIFVIGAIFVGAGLYMLKSGAIVNLTGAAKRGVSKIV